ncbi:MAG TPA: DUF5670 family protein [Candidatus Limnocylindria bacterium]|jgi:hypothetical protein|nr:DUF5670 family protein [Candidatus Limnocylindria bacterium]
MGIVELLIVVLLLMWLFGYFGRGRWYATGPAVTTSTGWWAGGGWVHTLLVIVVILVILRLLGIA